MSQNHIQGVSVVSTQCIHAKRHFNNSAKTERMKLKVVGYIVLVYSSASEYIERLKFAVASISGVNPDVRLRKKRTLFLFHEFS